MKPLALFMVAQVLTGPGGSLPAWPDDVVHASTVAQTDPQGHDAATDAGAAPVAIWARCEEFAPDAGDVAQELPGGAVLLSSARARYDACKLGAAGKCSELLSQVDAGAAVDPTKSYTWIVTSAICALSGVASAYINNRTARHLPILP